MTPLSSEELLYLHHRIIEESGGSHGVRDPGLIEAALARPFAGFGAYEAFPTLCEKVAALLDALIRNHPFVDGNKRTGMMAAVLLLDRNGHRLDASQEAFEEFAVTVATDHPAIDVIAAWLDVNSLPSVDSSG